MSFQQRTSQDPATYLTTLADKHLTGLAWEVFMIRHLSELMAASPTLGEQLLTKYYARFTHKRWLDSLRRYYQDYYTLKPGQKAPNFVLEGASDSLFRLNDYQGQVIYLSFWFTGCAPCRQEMPYENALVKYFAGKPVKIISICVKSGREDWRKVSRLYDLQTVNLYANKHWENALLSKYNVHAYPHYVLINQAGEVVKNNCSRPSGGAKESIESLLSP